MTTSHENICCSEVDRVVEKKEEGSSLALLTTKFFIACVWTFGCCKQPASTTSSSIMVWLKRRLYIVSTCTCILLNTCENLIFFFSFLCRRYRFMAYSQLTGWCWSWSSRRVRVVLPSCAVTKIRNSFPSAAHAGFKYPQI